MRAVTFHAPRALRVEHVPDPRIEHPGDAVVRVTLGAVCGSDLHVYRGHEGGLDAGTVMGHEFLGEVVEVGGEVERVTLGQRVVSPFTTSCGGCFFCGHGLTSRCEHGALFGWRENGTGLHGAQAEYVRVPLADSTLVAVPDGHAREEALLVGDVLSTAFFCAENGGVTADTTACVLGCGPVGLLAVQAARVLGASAVYAVDAVPERLELAARFGAKPVRLESDPVATIARATDHGVDVVLECVGSAASSRLAYDLVRPGGTISAVGVHTEPHFAFSPGAAYDKNLTYRAGRAPVRHYMERMLALLGERRLDVAPLLTHRVGLDEVPRGYELFDAKRDGCIKVLVEP